MLRTSDLVFDDVVQGTAPVYTAPKWNRSVSDDDSWMLFAVASPASGTSPVLYIDCEISSDSVTWLDIGPVFGAGLSTTDKTSGITPAIMGLLEYIRFRIYLTGTNPSTRLKVWFTGRELGI